MNASPTVSSWMCGEYRLTSSRVMTFPDQRRSRYVLIDGTGGIRVLSFHHGVLVDGV